MASEAAKRVIDMWVSDDDFPSDYRQKMMDEVDTAIDAAIREAVKAEREAILLLVASEREPSADDAPSYMIDGTITARDAAIAAVRATKRCINDRIRARTPQQETHDE